MKKTPAVFAFCAALLLTTATGESPIPAKTASEEAAQLKLKFQAYDGDPADPKSMTFQINALDLRQPTEFLQLGQSIANMPYRLESFTAKTRKDPKTGVEQDVSELTLTHTGTKEKVVLPLNVTVDVKGEVPKSSTEVPRRAGGLRKE